MDHLSHPGEHISYNKQVIAQKNALKGATKDALVRVVHWHPKRTHEVGKDENGNVRDFVAIWRHK